MASPDIPNYEVTVQRPQALVRNAGEVALSQIVAISPAPELPENFFMLISKKDNVGVRPLHKIGEKVLLFEVSAVEPGAAERLGQAEIDLAILMNAWHDPVRAINILYPDGTAEEA